MSIAAQAIVLLAFTAAFVALTSVMVAYSEAGHAGPRLRALAAIGLGLLVFAFTSAVAEGINPATAGLGAWVSVFLWLILDTAATDPTNLLRRRADGTAGAVAKGPGAPRRERP